MNNNQLLFAIVLLPVCGAFILPVVGQISARLRNLLSFVIIAATFLISLKFIHPALASLPVYFDYGVSNIFRFSLTADMLAVFMAATSSLIGLIIVFYSFGYIAHYRNQNEYYFLVVLFLGSMMGIVFSANLIFLYIFWELTAICSWRLIGFFREKTDILRADKAFLVTFFGAALMLLGFIMIFQETGSFDLVICKEYFKAHPFPNLAVTLILVGILSKSATLPLQTWLPDAGVAPSPVTALLHAAVLVKIGVYVYARLFVMAFPVDAFWHTAIPVIAGLSAVISAAAAFVEKDLKRIIAYSTISQIGFIFFGLSLDSNIGVAAGLLYILMHGLAKAGLFLCAGIVEQNTHTKDITKLGGLISTMPFTAMAFLACAFSVMGIPPFGGFFAKFLIFRAGFLGAPLWINIVYLIGACMTILYLLRVFVMVFLGEARISAREGTPAMVFSVTLLGVLSLAGGIFITYPMGFLNTFVNSLALLSR
jgi:NADH:ubiquinone oxidoreductase subunit 5 (subunit L)/multisubunit Na+/H+ antiporter MnhA subunit